MSQNPKGEVKLTQLPKRLFIICKRYYKCGGPLAYIYIFKTNNNLKEWGA